MVTFSKRNQFDPRIPTVPVIEDAPKVLRLEYWKRVLEPLTYIDKDSRYERNEEAILGRKRLLEDLCMLLHLETTDGMNDSWFCTDELKSLVMDTAWYHFYDIAEHVANLLLKEGDRNDYAPHRELVNSIFDSNLVVWNLNSEGLLTRTALQDLEEKSEAVELVLSEGFPSALQNLQKAKRFLSHRPLDPENAIKEAVSAVESYGRALYPSANTLGDVIKELRKTPFPALLLTMVEKFYAFSSSEPGIRHGGAVSSRTSLADADFSLYVSVAFIDYLHKFHEK